MMDLEAIFQAHQAVYNLDKKPFLLMVSGGVDSMVLLDIARKTTSPKSIWVLHIDHGTRSESASDAGFVQSLCEEIGVHCITKKLQEAPKKNRENAWRKQRIKLSTEVQNTHNLHAIYTAHHATDLVETVLYRLTKGAGIVGLAPFDIAKKPFWQVQKSALLAYAKCKNLTWKEDKTNIDTRFERNKIRHNVLPHLRQITPNLEQVFVRNSFLYRQYQDYMSTVLPMPGPLLLADFLILHPLLQGEFLRSLTRKTPSGDELQDALRWLENNPMGNTKKQLGGTLLHLRGGVLHPLWNSDSKSS